MKPGPASESFCVISPGPGMHDMIDINSAVSHLPSYLLLMTLVTAYFLKF